MKKILLLFDGPNFSEGAFQYVQHLHRLSPVLVTGVFFPQPTAAGLWSYPAGVPAAVLNGAEETDIDTSAANADRFARLCSENGMKCVVRNDRAIFGVNELKKESRFADLLVIGGETFYRNWDNSEEYLKSVLEQAECPVIVVPEEGYFPETNILSYDGSASAIYAIKQYAYLFPELVNRPTLLVYLERDNESIPEKERIEELARQHFPQLSLIRVDSDRRDFFKSWISDKEKGVLISGAFGRSAVSQFFRKSFISDLLQEHRLPIFIAHK